MLLLAVSLLASAGGCAWLNPVNAYHQETIPQPRGTLSVYQLAGMLGMKVTDVSATSATLQDPRNTVLLLGDPGGQAYVNGRPVGPTGGYEVSDSTLFVPRVAVESIRSSLQPVPEIVVRQRRRPRRAPEAETPRVRRLPRSSAGGLVMLDPGHGGKDPGATSVTGMSEKWINLAIAKRMANMLRQAGVKAVLTRDDDSTLSLQARAKLANQRRPDLLVSIHADWFKRASVHGFNAYVAPVSSAASYRAALEIATAMKGAGVATHGQAVRRRALHMVVRTACPAVLVETGFLSNPREGAKLATPDHQQAVAYALAGAIIKHLEAEAKRD
jgi:N-acetylmuramoyl-L-alanine amidase